MNQCCLLCVSSSVLGSYRCLLHTCGRLLGLAAPSSIPTLPSTTLSRDDVQRFYARYLARAAVVDWASARSYAHWHVDGRWSDEGDAVVERWVKTMHNWDPAAPSASGRFWKPACGERTPSVALVTGTSSGGTGNTGKRRGAARTRASTVSAATSNSESGARSSTHSDDRRGVSARDSDGENGSANDADDQDEEDSGSGDDSALEDTDDSDSVGDGSSRDASRAHDSDAVRPPPTVDTSGPRESELPLETQFCWDTSFATVVDGHEDEVHRAIAARLWYLKSVATGQWRLIVRAPTPLGDAAFSATVILGMASRPVYEHKYSVVEFSERRQVVVREQWSGTGLITIQVQRCVYRAVCVHV